MREGAMLEPWEKQKLFNAVETTQSWQCIQCIVTDSFYSVYGFASSDVGRRCISTIFALTSMLDKILAIWWVSTSKSHESLSLTCRTK